MKKAKISTAQRVREYIAEHPGATRIQICVALNITGESASSALSGLSRYKIIYRELVNQKARYFCTGSTWKPRFGTSYGTWLLNNCLAAVRRRSAENQNTTNQA